MARPRVTPLTAKPRRQWEKKWLEAFRKEKSVSGACKVVGIDRQTPYNRRRQCEKFAAEWDAIEGETNDLLVKSALARAVSGHEKPVYYQGVECGKIREFETALTIFMLKKRIPEIYADTPDDSKSKSLDDLKDRICRTIDEAKRSLEGHEEETPAES